MRREGLTVRARAGELKMLERRLLSGHSKTFLDVRLDWWDEPHAVTPVRLDETEIENWVASERGRLRRPPEAPELPKLRMTKASPTIVEAERALGFSSSWEPERRTPEQYDNAVEAYLEQGSAEFPALIRAKAVEQRLGLVELAVANDTEDNCEAVVVDVYFPGTVRAYFTEDDAWSEAAGFPGPPRKWGPWRKNPLASLASRIAVHPRLGSYARARRGRIDNSGSARIKFEPVHLRPGHKASLREVHLVVTAPPLMTQLVGTWTATSTSLSGTAEGTFALDLESPVGAVDLLQRPQPTES